MFWPPLLFPSLLGQWYLTGSGRSHESHPTHMEHVRELKNGHTPVCGGLTSLLQKDKVTVKQKKLKHFHPSGRVLGDLSLTPQFDSSAAQRARFSQSIKAFLQGRNLVDAATLTGITPQILVTHLQESGIKQNLSVDKCQTGWRWSLCKRWGMRFAFLHNFLKWMKCCFCAAPLPFPPTQVTFIESHLL